MDNDIYIKKIQELTIVDFKKLKHNKLMNNNEYLFYKSSVIANDTLIIYLSGGGYYLPVTKQDDKICKILIKNIKSDILLYQYPLSPEFQFPQNISIAYKNFKKLIEKYSSDYNKIILLGISSGANLAASISLNYSLNIDGLILISPSLDYYNQNYKSKKEIKNLGLNEQIRFFLKKEYLGSYTNYKNSLISPIYSQNINKLPKTLVHISELDPLKDEAILFVKKLKENNVNYTYMKHETIHNYFNYRIEPFFNKTINSISKFIEDQYK